MSEQEPLRLTDPASGAPNELRALFDAGARDLPTEAQLARLSQKLGPLLGPSGGGTASGGSSAAGLGKLGAALAVLVGGAVLVANLNDEVPKSVPEPRSLPAAPAAEKPSHQVALEPTAAARASGIDSAEAPPSGAERSAPRAAPRSSGEIEVELLERARAALGANPNHALSLTSEHKLRFPGGVLAQEREVIAIEALRRLGKNDQASLRADEFAKNYPRSAHRHKLDAGATR
jgi:hypothetical protein